MDWSPEERESHRCYRRRIKHERSLGRAYVGTILDDLCRHFGLDPLVAWRGVKVERKCPRPEKRRFETRDECVAAFANLIRRRRNLEIYLCRCGSWHAGNSETFRRQLASQIDPTVAERLRVLSQYQPKEPA